jgi:hypothetical protein
VKFFFCYWAISICHFSFYFSQYDS